MGQRYFAVRGGVDSNHTAEIGEQVIDPIRMYGDSETDRRVIRNLSPSSDEHHQLRRRVDDIDDRLRIASTSLQQLADDQQNLRGQLDSIFLGYSKDIGRLVKWTEADDERRKKESLTQERRERLLYSLIFANVIMLVACFVVIVIK